MAELLTRSPDKEPAPWNNLLIDQIRAAKGVYDALHTLETQGKFNRHDPSLIGVAETDVFRLRRGLCLPSAVGVGVNLAYGQRIIGDDDGGDRVLDIGDVYKMLIPHHGRYPSESMPRGWWVVTTAGDMYHHAAVALAHGLGLECTSVQGIGTLGQFSGIINSGAGVAVSLNNKFVVEQTLRPFPDSVKREGEQTYIRVDGANGPEWKLFQDGRHVVDLLSIHDTHEGAQVTFADSFNLPQTGNQHGLTVTLPIEVADRYLKYHDGAQPRALVISRKPVVTDTLTPIQTYVPPEVERGIHQYLTNRNVYTS